MTPEIALVLIILAAALILFVSERLRVDLVAILVLVALAIAGLVSPAEALSGFSNAAVVTVWAIFVLSGGLTRTGVASLAGRYMSRMGGGMGLRLLVVIMVVAGLLSAFMNNVGVAALMLPVVMDLARRAGRSPSRLLLPLAYATLLGGLITLIGTPSNILVSDALRQAGLTPFGMFDFALMGLPILFVGVVYMALVGRRLLPETDLAQAAAGSMPSDPGAMYRLEERLFVIRLPADSPLTGRTLAEVRLGAALGLNVVGITRGTAMLLAPEREMVLQGGDRLLVSGLPDWFEALQSWHRLDPVGEQPALDALTGTDHALAEVRLAAGSRLIGQSLRQAGFRSRFGVNVLALATDGIVRRAELRDLVLAADTTLLVLGTREHIDRVAADPEFAHCQTLTSEEVAERYRLSERLVVLNVPAGSALDGTSLGQSRLGEAFGLLVLGIRRGGVLQVMPSQEAVMEAGDLLVVQGRGETVSLIAALQALEVDSTIVPDLAALESEQVGLAEVILSPYGRLAGATLRELRFREKYDLSVLAIWREGRAFRSRLSDMPLKLGDALLVYGRRERLAVLGPEPDFIVLTESVQEAPRSERAPVAALIMVAVLLPVILGWLPIAIAAVAGAALMVLTGCLTMDEAYRFIDWRAVFLIAGMLPLGIAMEQTGAAQLLADGVVAVLQPLGWVALVVGLFLLSNLATQVMPNPAVAVLMAPIALGVAAELGMSPYALMMVVAVGASASVMSPVAHPANVMVMGPGGYRFMDYIRVGLPLTAAILVVLLLLLPLVWPLYP